MWTDIQEPYPLRSDDEQPWADGIAMASPPLTEAPVPPTAPREVQEEIPGRFTPSLPAQPQWQHGWPIPSTVSLNPDEARSYIHLPTFNDSLLELAQVISGRYPLAEAEYRNQRGRGSSAEEIPHFERVFRIAAELVGVPDVQESRNYDELLILTAWHSVRPGVEGFLGSYPKSLLCPLSHTAPPVALETLSPARRITFDRRAPVYLRYLLSEKFGLRTCTDVENADLRHLLRSAGFRLIYPSAVPEVAFAGATRGEDPPIRPWKLTLRQELSDDRAAEMLIHAALWQIKYGLHLVTFEQGRSRWNIGAFERVDWEDAFLSLGVRVSPSLMRESGLLDWRPVSRANRHWQPAVGCLGQGRCPAATSLSRQRSSHLGSAGPRGLHGHGSGPGV